MFSFLALINVLSHSFVKLVAAALDPADRAARQQYLSSELMSEAFETQSDNQIR